MGIVYEEPVVQLWWVVKLLVPVVSIIFPKTMSAFISNDIIIENRKKYVHYTSLGNLFD